MAAGIQPRRVIWRIRQMIPVIILPRRKNERNGNMMAISVMQT
jgi:hypothetical protein